MDEGRRDEADEGKNDRKNCKGRKERRMMGRNETEGREE